ncbi:pilus assembly protein TadG-related protein [Planctomicrobium sp.]|nr:TadE/TadG family type IV pilus assembly protein [Planctomicrobium sp.]MDB4733225.1 pilus assembly protein TadG-related protein [Planctomicrobium sp.]
MNILNVKSKLVQLPSDESTTRRGAFLVLSAFCLTGCLAFVSLAVDIAFLNLTKQQMQNGVDSAALAAAQEITAAVNTAPPGTVDVTQYARDQARLVAANVAELNGVYVNSQIDVKFGKRYFDDTTQKFEVEWDVSPSNVVKVIARRDQEDHTAQDGKVRLFFAAVTGDRYAKLKAEAVAYVESRDIVVVHDFSRSMNFDSYYTNETNARLSDAQVEANMALVWSDLQMPNTGTLTFAPQFLTVDETSNGVSASVTFKYDDLTVTSDGDIEEVRVQYDNNNYQTFSNLSGNSVNINGYRNIDTAWVTARGPNSNAPVTVTNQGISVTFSGDRKSASISSPDRIRLLNVGFTNNSTDDVSYGSNGPYNANYSSWKEIDYMYLETWDGRSYWYYFNAPNGGNAAELRFDDTNTAVKNAFGLTGNYPYPYGSWDSFINHARSYSEFSSRGYRETYGGLTLVNYIMREESGHWKTPDLWKTRHYPFHAIKEGHMLLCDFLEDLGFDDHIGMVSYDTYHRKEMVLNESDPNIPYVDISSEPITDDYTAVKKIMEYKQAAHYAYATNMGGGLEDGIELMLDNARDGARRTILLMTDGNTNTMDNNASSSLPNGWSWDELFDYDGDGSRDYYTSSSQRRYVLKVAYEAVESGITVHTMSVGIDADRDLMEAIAHLAGGHYIDVPGGFSVADMETEVEAAFHKIASFVPPAKLMNNE